MSSCAVKPSPLIGANTTDGCGVIPLYPAERSLCGHGVQGVIVYQAQMRPAIRRPSEPKETGTTAGRSYHGSPK